MHILSQLKTNSLLVASTVDPASLNIARSLLSRTNIWKEVDKGKIWITSSSIKSRNQNENNSVFLWLQQKPLLHLNYADECFKNELLSSASYNSVFGDENESITPKVSEYINKLLQLDDVVFLSKHSAASGIASLTVHPIGIPWSTDIVRNGGLAGRCSPPSFRISTLYRSLLQRVNEHHMENKCQVTLEATHHGPYVNLPTCFVEIGSTENEWSREDLGEIWTDVLLDHFGLSNKETNLNIDDNTNTNANTNTNTNTNTNANSNSLPSILSSVSNNRDESVFNSITSSVNQNDNKDMNELSLTTPSSTTTNIIETNNDINTTINNDVKIDGNKIQNIEELYLSKSCHLTGVVMLLIGGGHYVPKMNDACRFGEGLYIGHALATYTLQSYFEELDKTHNNHNQHGHADTKAHKNVKSNTHTHNNKSTLDKIEIEEINHKSTTSTSVIDGVDGGWEYIITEAVTSTRLAFPVSSDILYFLIFLLYFFYNCSILYCYVIKMSHY